MSERKRKPRALSGMPFDEALARLIQTDPKEIADALERNKERADDIERSVAERRERLRAATRGPKKKFRL
jgi:hypothetical protein